MECPNLSHPDNKLVISKLGENAFWSIWNQNNGIIPQFIIEQLKSDSKSDNVKQGISELFESNPELSSIGTPEQYSEYLDIIFPESKVKDIVYHRSREKFDSFDFSKIGSETGVDSGVFFSDKQLTNLQGFPHEIKAIVNISDLSNKSSYGSPRGVGPVNQITVQKPEQIHILGSKRDIEGFKSWVDNKNTFDKGLLQKDRKDALKIAGLQYLETTLETLSKKFGLSYEIIFDENNPNKGYVDVISYSQPTIVINAAKATHDTPLHEYGHIFINLIKSSNKNLYSTLIKEVLNTEQGKKELKAVQEHYVNYTLEEQIEETIVQLLGEYAAGNLDPKSGLHKTIKKIWDSILEFLSKAFNVEIKDISPNTSLENLAKLLANPNINFNQKSFIEKNIGDIKKENLERKERLEKEYLDFQKIENPSVIKEDDFTIVVNSTEYELFNKELELLINNLKNYSREQLNIDIKNIRPQIETFEQRANFNYDRYPLFTKILPFIHPNKDTALWVLNNTDNLEDRIKEVLKILDKPLNEIKKDIINGYGFSKSLEINIPDFYKLPYKNDNINSVKDIEDGFKNKLSELDDIIKNPEKSESYYSRAIKVQIDDDTYSIRGSFSNGNISIAFSSGKYAMNDANKGLFFKVLPKVIDSISYMFSDVEYNTISFLPVSGESSKGRDLRLKGYNIFAKRLFGQFSVVAENENTTIIPVPNAFKNRVHIKENMYQVGRNNVSNNSFQQSQQSLNTPVLKDNQVEYSFKAVNTIVKNLNNIKQWEKNKAISEDILWKKIQELGVPKEQIELVKNSEGSTVEEKLLDFTNQYSYTVEINTAEEPKNYDNIAQGFQEVFEYNNEQYFYDEWDGYFKEGVKITKKEFEEAKQKSVSDKPTQHYSNLTVPGGTNYTENAIQTPNIINTSTAHINDFAKGIANMLGWFRSDEQTEKNTQEKEEYIEYDTEDGETLIPIKKQEYKGGVPTKTRRILEVQSDLFQKGRGKENLIGASINNKKYVEGSNLIKELNSKLSDNPFDTEVILNGKKYDKEGLNGNWFIVGETKKTTYDYKNQFLQLLNKDNNWVTFFVKSVIQDSAKKGYEKVLFPKGDTAAKIEGHTTLEEFKKQKEDRIKELEKQEPQYAFTTAEASSVFSTRISSRFNDNYNEELRQNAEKYKGKYIVVERSLGDDGRVYGVNLPEDLKNIELYNTKEEAEKISKSKGKRQDNEIAKLKQELADVESGQTQLSSIAKFYEETVTNILKKQGYNPIEITDEHGNKWNEVTIDPIKDSSPILFNKNQDNNFDVILPIGTSGSGKSTFIKSLPQENLVVIEPDAMRVEFTGDMNDKSKDKEIYEEAAKRAIAAIKQGKQVVFDTTNLTKDKRLPFIEAIKKELPDANIKYKLMPLDPELAKQRVKADIAAGKNRANVSDATIDRHAESYKQMLEDIKNEPISNYDDIKIISSNKVNDIIKEINKEKAANKNKISKSLFERAYEILKNAGIKFKYSTTKDGKYGIIIESHSFSDLFKEGMNMNVQTLFSRLESKGLMNNTLKLVKSKFTNNTVNIKLINSLEGHSITGNDDFNAFYDPHNNTIYLNSEKILKDKSDMQDILAEELLHAQLFQTLENNDVKAREFSDFYQFVKDKLTSIYGDKYDRVMANEHEFIAALFYDKDLQRDLNSIPSSNSERKSFFADIWDKILSILKFKVDDRSVLAEGLSRATELLEKSQNIQNDTELLPRGELPFLFNSAKDTSFYGDQLARFRDRTGKEATLAQKNTFEKALQARVGTNLDEKTHTYTRNGVKFKSQSEYVSSSDPMYNSEMSEEDKDKYENNRQWGNQVDHLLCLGLIGYTKEEAIKEFKDKFPDSLLSNEVIEKVYEGMEGLLKKYKDCLFSTQQPLYNLGRKIMGTADIMVIFPDGRIKIIDIKSSIYPVGYNNGTFESYTTLTGKEGRYDKGGKTWVSKKQKHEAQLSCYKGMAEYLGFQFVDDAVSVLPVHVVPSSENPNIITDVTVEPEVKNIRVSAKFSEILKTDSEVIKNDTKGNDLIETLTLQITDRMKKLKGKSSKKAEYFKLEEFLKKDLSTMESISAAKEFIDTIHKFLVYDPEGYGTVKHAFDKFINDLEENPNEVNSLVVAKKLSEYRVLINTYEPLINQIKDLYLEMEKSGENLNENDTYKQIEAILKDFSRIKVDYNNNINKYLAIRLADEVNPEAVERLEKHVKQLEDQYNKFTPSQKEGNAGKYNRKRLEKVQAELRRKVTASGLEEELIKGAESDIPFIDFLITAAISSSNPVVAGVAKLFKRGYEEIRTKCIEIAKKFDKTFTKFKKEVGHSENNAVMYKGMFEKSKEYDKQTGELKDVMVFTQPFDYGKFNEEKDKMYKSLEGKSEEERKRIREEFKKNHCEPLSKESIVVNGVTIVKGQNELIAEREKLVREGVWTQKQFDKWLKDMHNINFMGEEYYSNVFLQPAAKYKNPKFNELVNGTNARSEMFRLLLSEYFKAQELVPNPNGFRLPAIPKSNLDFILESPKDYFKFQKERFLDYGKEDEDVYTKDEKRKDPPVLFSYFIEPENVSLDLVQSVLSYSEMAMRYEFNSENLPLALSALEQLENTPPVQTNSLGIKTEHPLAKKLNIKGWSKYLKKHNGNNAAALLEAFIDMQVLNMRQKKEEISILGRNINAGKMVNNIMGIASIVNIGGNPILSVANSLQANGQMLIESAAKEFFTDKDLAWAKYKYYDYMRLDFLKDASGGTAKTMIGQLIELYDPMQGEYRDKYGNKITKKQFLRMFNTDLWFAGQWMGEHAAAVQSMLALMHSTKVKDSKGSEISLFDAYEFDKNAGKLKLKKGVLLKGKVSSNGLLAFDVQNRLHAINKRLHGVYNNFDAPTMSRFALGRLALMYRKHIGPGFKRRFKGYSLDQELGAETEGMYMTYYSTLFNQPVEFLREISPLHKSDLTDLQKANLRRTLREQTLMMLTFFIAMLLESMIEDADDDEKAKYQYVLYQALRMNQELGAYGGLGNPATGIIMPDLKGIYRSWRTPTAAYGLLENSINFLLQFGDPSATLEKDKGWLKKGDSKLKARFFNLIGIRGNNVDPDKALEMFER